MQPNIERKHKNCQFEIRHKFWATGQLVPGLFCRDHNTMIDWLRPHQRDRLVQELNLPVVDWYPTNRQQRRKKHLEKHGNTR